MSIELQNPETVLGKVDAAWNFVEQIRLAMMVRDQPRMELAISEASRLLSTAVEQLEEAERPVMYNELSAYVGALTITSENIGGIRARLLMPFDCQWNGWVRDLTAERENK